MIEHVSPVSGIATHGESYIATAGYDNQLILWDRTTGAPIHKAMHDHLVNQCTFSPDGTALVSASSDYSARIWAVPDLRLISVLKDHEDDVEMAVFDPDGRRVATASRDHRARVFDLEGRLLSVMNGHTADVISVAWSASGEELVTSSDDGTVKRWNADTGELTDDIDVGGVETDTLVIDSQGTIYAGNDDGMILIFTGDSMTTHEAHRSGVKRIVLSPAEDRLLTLSYDRTLALWDITDKTAGPRLALRADILADVWPRSAAFLGDDIVFGTFGARYRTFETAREAWAEEEVCATPGVNAAAPLPDQRILTVGDAGVLAVQGEVTARAGSLCNFIVRAFDEEFTGGQLGILFRARTGEAVHQHRSPLNCGTYLAGSGAGAEVPRLVVGTYTGEALVFARPDGRLELDRSISLHENAIKGLASDSELVFSVCADTGVAWSDATSLETVFRIDHAHDRIVNDCAALGAGRFVSVGRDRVLKLWSREFEGTAVKAPNTHSIKCVAASSDGRQICCGDYGGGITLYEPQDDHWTVLPRVTAQGISAMAFDERADRFIASSYDGLVYAVSRDTAGWRAECVAAGPRTGLPILTPTPAA